MNQRITLSVVQSEAGSGNGPTVSGTTFRTGSAASSVDRVFGVVADSDLPVAFTVADLQSVVMSATKDVTIKVNSTSAPDATIGLKAGSPLFWQADDGYFANPFTGATTVAHLYVTTAASARLQILANSN